MKLKLLCPNKSLFSKKNLNFLKKKFYCKFKNLNQNEFNTIAHDYDVILMRFSLDLKYKKKSKIKYIISPTTGLNHIDNQILKSKKIKIFNLTNKKFLIKVNATAEHTILLILKLLKKSNTKIKFGFRKSYEKYIVNELHDKKVGIIGYGRIGKKVAKICSSFGAKILIHDKYKKVKQNKTLSFVLKNSDILTFHIPYNDKTHNLFDSIKLKLIKDKTILINTSRGEIFNEKDLLKETKKKKLRLGLDVISNENSFNFKKNIFLRTILNNPHCIITPHIGGLSKESIELTDNHVISNFLKKTNL
jgi:D-3-phosphoglycerate dehydrogenase